MTDEELRRVVKEAVHETLSAAGFDMGDIHEAQADLIYLRRIRRGSEDLPKTIKRAIVTALIPTVLYIAWDALKNKIKNG